MGLNTILIIAGVVVGLLIIGIPIWYIRKTEDLKKAVEKKVYVTTMRKSGSRINGLYPADEHTVKIKRQKKEVSVVLSPKSTFNMLYPPHEGTKSFLGKIFSPTVTVRSIVVAESHGGAWKPFDEEPNVTDEELQSIKEQAFTKAAMEAGYEYTNPEGSGKFPIKKTQLLVGALVMMVLLIAVGIMSYITMTQLDTVAQGWGI